MTEIEQCWQDIDRAIGYIRGFMPAIYALAEVQTSDLPHDIVSIESIIECENAVKDLATKTARLRELVSGEVVTQ